MYNFLGVIPTESVIHLPRFQTKDGEHFIDLRRIVCLNAQLNYTMFQLDDGERVVTSHSLSMYAALLEKQGFIRLHKSHLLNLYYLSQCQILHFERLVLPSGQILEISRRKRTVLRRTLKSLKEFLRPC